MDIAKQAVNGAQSITHGVLDAVHSGTGSKGVKTGQNIADQGFNMAKGILGNFKDDLEDLDDSSMNFATAKELE